MWQAYQSQAWYYLFARFILRQAKWLLLLDGLVAYSLLWACEKLVAFQVMGGDHVGFTISDLWPLPFGLFSSLVINTIGEIF